MLWEAVFMEKGIFWARRDADGKIELLTVKTQEADDRKVLSV